MGKTKRRQKRGYPIGLMIGFETQKVFFWFIYSERAELHKMHKMPRKFENMEKEAMAWGLGIAGEAGDVAGCIKKTFAHGNDQKAGIRENIGDTMWYAAMLCNVFGWDFQQVLEENIAKLKARYPDGKFTVHHASRNNTRIDWNEKGK